MASDLGVANRALQKLGSSTVLISFDDDNTAGRAMKIAYASIRDAELRRRRWRFSITRANLPALTAVPTNGIYTMEYQLPTDCLRVLEVGDYWVGNDTSDYRTRSVSPFQLEGRQILTNLGSPLSLRYVRQVTDAGLFDAAFAESLSARIAWELCEAITQSGEKRKLAIQEYKQAIMEATRANALESPPEFKGDDSWVLGRVQ